MSFFRDKNGLVVMIKPGTSKTEVAKVIRQAEK